jgi:hypothetical protein
MPHVLLTSFQARLAQLARARVRMEKLYDDDGVALRDTLALYEALFLRAVVAFEEFLEEVFFLMMQRRITRAPQPVHLGPGYCRISPRFRAGPVVMREVVFQGENYLKWLPIRDTIDRAELYLIEGRPFTNLDVADKQVLHDITTVRNAISHNSAHSLRTFLKMIEGMPLLRGESTPAGFLRSKSNPTQTRFEVYMGNLGTIAAKLC